MKFQSTILLMLLWIAGALPALAQDYYYQKKTSDVKQNANYSSFLRLDLVSIAEGDVGLLFEKRFNERLGLEVGAGVLTGNQLGFIPLAASGSRSSSFNPDKGFSFLIAPTLRNRYFPNFYRRLMFRSRNYSQSNFKELVIGGGYTYYISNRLFAELELNGGLIWQNAWGDNPTYRFYDSPLGKSGHTIGVINVALRIGMALK